VITVFPMAALALCSCSLSQGIEDSHAAVSYVRVYDACRPGEMVRRFVLETERWRFMKDEPVRSIDFGRAAWVTP